MFTDCVEATTDQYVVNRLAYIFEFYEPEKTFLVHFKEQPMKIDYLLNF